LKDHEYNKVLPAVDTSFNDSIRKSINRLILLKKKYIEQEENISRRNFVKDSESTYHFCVRKDEQDKID
jgi:hypothetical protein